MRNPDLDDLLTDTGSVTRGEVTTADVACLVHQPEGDAADIARGEGSYRVLFQPDQDVAAGDALTVARLTTGFRVVGVTEHIAGSHLAVTAELEYAARHAFALSDAQARGAAITFTRGVPATASVAGYARRIKGDPERYAALSLQEEKSVTLEFVPTEYGDAPIAGDVGSWQGTRYVVSAVEPTAPDGTVIDATIVMRR